MESREWHLTVNGRVVIARAAPDERLLDVLRDQFGLRGTKEGCGRGECGACTVLVGGRPVVSCLTLMARVDEPVETVEGLADESRPLREALADCGGYQCGFCTPGQVVRATALLRAGLPESDAELRHEMSGNICRCTGYDGIVRALRAVGS
jgi:aerobic-type carbon monoxide dehydrogenase small subunit (CoxS/CutS family)